VQGLTGERKCCSASLHHSHTCSRSSNTYAFLTFLSEILSAHPLPGSLDLVSSLLDTLGKVVHDTSISIAEKTYVEQLLMSALENAAINIPASRIAYSSSLPLIGFSRMAFHYLDQMFAWTFSWSLLDVGQSLYFGGRFALTLDSSVRKSANVQPSIVAYGGPYSPCARCSSTQRNAYLYVYGCPSLP
jgi:hypothetical protein